MICATSPAATRLDYVAEWRTFVAEVEQPDQPQCQWCGIRHELVPWHPYCTMRRQFYARLPKRREPLP